MEIWILIGYLSNLHFVYAQIVSLRRQSTDGTLNLQDGQLYASLTFLRQLADNLETILLANPKHEQKESIAFVAATANNLIYKIAQPQENLDSYLSIDNISPLIAATILFLIGNSQADAAEMSISLSETKISNLTQQRLVASVAALATGKLAAIADAQFVENEINNDDDIQEIAVNYLWRELGLGILDIGQRLTKQSRRQEKSLHFDNVIELAVSEHNYSGQSSTFTGPFRLAKLLKMLENDIFDRSVIDIPAPSGVDPILWATFLEDLAKERPYLWENHKQAVDTDFLTPGTSAVLTLPTGAGKSTLSELKIATCVYSNRRVIYLVPTHALEDQVNRNLRELFINDAALNFEVDAEYTEFGVADSFPIMVMTLERCLTLMNMNPDLIRSVGLVVFDEFHLIHGTNIKKDRRAIDAMYCLLSLFTSLPQSDYLLISAMVSNGVEICDWIQQTTGRECLLFNSSWKPTRQLHGCLVFEEAEIIELRRTVMSEKLTRKNSPSAPLKRSLVAFPHCFFSLKNIWETTNDADYFQAPIMDQRIQLGINAFWGLTSNRNDVASQLALQFTKLGLKTLVFVDDPRNAGSVVRKIQDGLTERANNYAEFSSYQKHNIDTLTLELGNIRHSYFNEQQNVGVHHGLLLPIERNIIEQYFKSSDGSIALVATATLAQGINLPAEIVIIAGDDRYNEEGGMMEGVKPHELLNAAGRAGRAGQSSQGAVILIPGSVVTINNNVISQRWWDLKNSVFSKGDQCLKIEDPLQYFLDSLQESGKAIDIDQTNVLYKFKAESLSENETRSFIRKSLYFFQAIRDNKLEQFDSQVNDLFKRRNELDQLSKDIAWTKLISFKTGIDPSVVLSLGDAIDQEDYDYFLSCSVPDLIDWFFSWLQSKDEHLDKIFQKPGTIDQIRRAIGIRSNVVVSTRELLDKILTLRDILKSYVAGEDLSRINDLIPESTVYPDKSPHLMKARKFVIRLLPELSFSFGLFSMVLVEKASQQGVEKDVITWNIKALGSCIREGFNTSEMLFFKRNNSLLMRVETHVAYAMQ